MLPSAEAELLSHVRMANERVKVLVTRGRLRSAAHVLVLAGLAGLVAAWWLPRVDRIVAVAAGATAFTFVAFAALYQVGALREFAARVRARAGADTGRPQRSDPSSVTRSIVAGVLADLGMRPDAVTAYVGPMEVDPASADLPLAAVLPPLDGTTVLLVDDDLERHIVDAAHGGSPYDSHPDDFLVEVRSVFTHELAHVQAWDSQSRPFALGFMQMPSRFSLACALLLSWDRSPALTCMGIFVLGLAGVLSATRIPERILWLSWAAVGAWMVAAWAYDAVTWSMLVVTALAALLPAVVSSAFERAQEYGADRISAVAVGSGRPLARFLRRFPTGSVGVLAAFSSHPSITMRLGRLARFR